MRGWFKKLLRIFEPVPERVRRIEVLPKEERTTLGTIWFSRVSPGPSGISLTYHHVKWDDSPFVCRIPSTSFIWHKGMWTLINRGNQKIELAGREVCSTCLRPAEKL